MTIISWLLIYAVIGLVVAALTAYVDWHFNQKRDWRVVMLFGSIWPVVMVMFFWFWLSPDQTGPHAN